MLDKADAYLILINSSKYSFAMQMNNWIIHFEDFQLM